MNALELADDLEYVRKYSDSEHWDTLDAVAAELRRLHELAMDQQGKIYALEMARSMEQKTAKLKRDAELRRLHEENQRCRDVCAATAEGWRVERDALLEALKDIERSTYDAGTAALARVAIAKAEESK